MAPALLGVGTAVPEQRVGQDEAARVAALVSGYSDDKTGNLSTLYRQTQIEFRHRVRGWQHLDDWLDHSRGQRDAPASEPSPTTAERMANYQREALPLALGAAHRALRSARSTPASISHLVTASCTGFAAPGFDIGLIAALPLPATVERTHIGFMGCHAAFNALRVARALATEDRTARVLVCTVELCSLHYQLSERFEQLLANALFADGAAALVVGGEGPTDAWRPAANGSCLFANSESAMTWTIGDTGFEMTLSKELPHLIATHLRPWLAGWLARQQLTTDDVKSWAIHPGGPRIVSSVEEALALPRGSADVSRDILREFGNMSSATIIFVLERLLRSGAPRPCVALGFGPGLTAEAILFR